MLVAVVAVGVRLARMSCVVVTVLVSILVGFLPATVLAVASVLSVSMLWSRGYPVPVMVLASSANHFPFDFSVRESFNWGSSVQISLISESSSLLSGVSVVVVRDLNIFFTDVSAGESGAAAVSASVMIVAMGVAFRAEASGMSSVSSASGGFRPIYFAPGAVHDDDVDVVESMESREFARTR
jgi:hypothetical protein